MLKVGAYLPNLVGEREGKKGFYGKYKLVSLGKTKADKKLCGNVGLCI